MQCDGDLMNKRSNSQACTEGICDINIQVNNFIRSAADIRIRLSVLLTSLSCCHCFKKTETYSAITKCPAGICCTVIGAKGITREVMKFFPGITLLLLFFKS